MFHIKLEHLAHLSISNYYLSIGEGGIILNRKIKSIMKMQLLLIFSRSWNGSRGDPMKQHM